MYKILIVEDDKNISEMVTDYLSGEGYEVLPVSTGESAISALEQTSYDLALIDLMLPGCSGFDVVKSIRKKSVMPVIIITAKDNDIDKTRGLNLGADDYVTKPFTPLELLARVNSQLRRYRRFMEKLGDKEKTQNIHVIGGLELDEERVEVRVDGELVKVTPMEYKILKLLIDNRGKVLTHNYILGQIWGSAQGVEAANLRVFMAALRRKIEKDPGNCRFILTEVGVGYRFREAVE